MGVIARQIVKGGIKLADKLRKVDAGDFFVQDNVDWIIKEAIHIGKEFF